MRNAFRDKVGSLPPDPVIVHWGTYLKAGEFYYKNMEKSKKFLEDITSQSNGAKGFKSWTAMCIWRFNLSS